MEDNNIKQQARSKRWYNKHADELKKKFLCKCGKTIQIGSTRLHLRSDRHKLYLMERKLSNQCEFPYCSDNNCKIINKLSDPHFDEKIHIRFFNSWSFIQYEKYLIKNKFINELDNKKYSNLLLYRIKKLEESY
jgi:hypothetical protein